ncbi:ArsR family transcriptional regulator [Halovivax sp.]|uniref:DUF7351 domain-containing protein n=1 Tax=Halovivax sp. TaxID=1935978 RepID=UPI0025BAF7E5|nr:ArsR family transcriptional regulator [Halovivax sp.]
MTDAASSTGAEDAGPEPAASPGDEREDISPEPATSSADELEDAGPEPVTSSADERETTPSEPADASPGPGGAPAGSPDPSPESAVVAEPSDAFQALGHEVRMEILEAMLERVDGEGQDRASFSELFEASSPETSAGFAYHLDELVGPYLRKTDDGYAFTYAGEKIARAVAAGAYTRRASSPSIGIDDPCPFCGADGLRAAAADNVVSIGCGDCERTLLRMGFPPTGFEAHSDRLPEAFDRHHRHRISLLRDGVCPECAGAVDGRLDDPTAAVADDLPEELDDHVQAAFDCRECGYDLWCPVTLAVLEHPDVVAFYRDHDREVRDRPIWNVGREWTETVLTREPAAVRVAVELDAEILELYVDGAASVVGSRRVDAE